MSIWWEADDMGAGSIAAVKVERATADFVWIKGRRRAKLSDWRSYFPTWSEAQDHLIALAQARVARARRDLDLASSKLGNIKGMKRPTPPVAGSGAEG